MAGILTLPDWKKWLRTARQTRDTAVLDRRHIYILPTRHGVIFGLVLLAMLIGTINYTLSLGFVLTFLLGGLGVVAMLHTWRNLAHLRIIAGKAGPVFVGEQARFSVLPADHHNRERLAIAAHVGKQAPVYTDVPAGGRGELELTLPATQRGWLELGRFTVFTEFPLGLFHAWSHVEIGARCLVYPMPAPVGLPLPVATAGEHVGGRRAGSGEDDFSGLRGYQPGDSLRRVDWKSSARSPGLLTKQFHGEAQALLWLDWSLTSGRNAEHRIAQLTRWVLDAHAAGLAYGLRMPDAEIAPGMGEAHYRQCLEALALCGMPR
ncbi:MAG: DUF58 domain-containing protein [Nitrosomonadales bacterium]|nr:MAG: DUF58 domain-containing protein [Nitrosomonadales bacterium]